MKKIILIGGGSASGKSFLANRISKAFNDHVLIISMDYYCVSHDELSFEERENLNYDHPTSYDAKELVNDLKNIMNSHSYSLPTYDYALHLRSNKKKHVKCEDIIIIDGIFSLYYKELLSLADIKIFCNASEETRLRRRIYRDINERGRTKESVLKQFADTVKPMHDLYIEPTKNNADIIFENDLDGEHQSINDIIEQIKLVL